MIRNSIETIFGNVIVGTAVLVFGLASVGTVIPAAANPVRLSNELVPPHKHFALHNYVSSKGAAELLNADPDILFVDVRDTVEVALSGYPKQIDAIVPFRIQTDVFDEELQEYALADNPDFLAQMSALFADFGKDKDSLVIITCGSGHRSAVAAQAMADAGYTNVWHIPDGYAGDDKPGLNLQNAWQLAGLAWSVEPLEGSVWMRLMQP